MRNDLLGKNSADLPLTCHETDEAMLVSARMIGLRSICLSVLFATTTVNVTRSLAVPTSSLTAISSAKAVRVPQRTTRNRIVCIAFISLANASLERFGSRAFFGAVSGVASEA